MTLTDSHREGVKERTLELSDNPGNMDEKITVKTSRIYLTAVIVNLSAMATGTCITWSSPIGPKLRAEDVSDSPLSRPVTPTEEAWINSVFSIGAMISSIIAGPLSDIIGRKKVLLSSSIFYILAFILLIIAREVWVLIVGRILQGCGFGWVTCVVPIYVGEISNDRTRGAAGAFMSFFLTFGSYCVFCIGPFVSYMVLQYFCLLIPFLFVVTFIFMPESPFYYAARNQRSAATKSLQFLRGQDAKTVEPELVNIESLVATSMVEKSGISDILKIAGNRKALLICSGLILFQQASGIAVVLFYIQTIFESAHISLKAEIATIIVGTIQIISAAIAPLVVNMFGRRVILLNSAAFMSIGLAAFGYFFYAQNILESTLGINWLPVAALVVFILAYNFGFGPLPYAVLGEIFPQNVKPFASALTTFTCCLAAFVVTIFFPALDALGSFYPFWLFAIICIIAFFFVLVMVIETKDLSFEEIQIKLNRCKNNNNV